MLARLLAALLLSLVVVGTGARAGSETDRPAIEAVIAAQIDAFRADDEATAYGFAAPTIKQIFPTATVFMDMVRKGYPQVYRPRSYRFGALVQDPQGRPVLRVTIVGPDGRTYEAVYTMEHQPDGTWKINGCTIVQVPGVDA
ncbi:MAG: DUF4864 domain-containing protein [Rhizobiales bacterium]|nr:DUF4864 domain-containing protein [Hyphomicrobiales bacterium]MBI3672634.1 DUF4864 domain-containing protein [Hyphomicrobiales bacterium]